MNKDNIDFAYLSNIALKAGSEIMKVYESDEFNVEIKDDDSPLTIADKRSHNVIVEGLESNYAQIPVLSEEGADISYEDRKDWESFWLVDPLDGTKEFIKKNGEFTVNIALIEGQYPTIGIIYAPALDTLYFGKVGLGGFKLERFSTLEIKSEQDLLNRSEKLSLNSNDDYVKVVASRSHMSEETQAFINDLESKHSQIEVVSAGSSLKFCLVAEGNAAYYPRFAPTMEWDTGAGQAIVEAVGGKVLKHENNERFSYNKENLLNGWFLVKR
ncbi:3'(2'),5'-bisphosphate nucleotidase CysQ [Salinibacillus xinjiangensis]|uniref:3'(2'),5'-bisphosphate nucleotidase CysQ n=1 Tax=Salinibacillus xinjiangensis TaxID=1229268 RepID=A0A6G1X2A3_9BACI|nr:3'(2'),5'-bisphosphate nucleotidase CysQ [Salinibacillus xinjiangensis]MRG85064.1 3'(2'),5'-bisphosphate nucleotidase CysQ [Salinibacillus xinjiangensis]